MVVHASRHAAIFREFVGFYNIALDNPSRSFTFIRNTNVFVGQLNVG